MFAPPTTPVETRRRPSERRAPPTQSARCASARGTVVRLCRRAGDGVRGAVVLVVQPDFAVVTLSLVGGAEDGVGFADVHEAG